jgi:hypothetical protein
VLIAVASVGALMLVMLAWFAAGLLFRWRFQFSLRSMLVLVVIVALASGWLATDLKKAREQSELVQELPAGVMYDWEFGNSLAWIPNAQPPTQAWLRALLGEEFFADAVDVHIANCADATLKKINRFTEIRRLAVNGTGVTDVGLENVKGLTRLQQLSLQDTKVTVGGLKQLGCLKDLRNLLIYGPGVTREEALDLQFPPPWREDPKRSGGVTREEALDLQSALPNCVVWLDGFQVF